jgi:hypothetical protein
MTPGEILDLASEKKLIIHRGQVFFNEWDHEEMRRFEQLGCRIVPWRTLEEVERARKRGRPMQGWEVHLLAAVDPIIRESLTGERVDQTPGILLEEARRRLR